MKTRYFILAGAAILSFVSCQRGKTPISPSSAEVIYVRLADKADTRAAEATDVEEEELATSEKELLFSIPVVTDEGDTLRVDAWLSDMDEAVLPALEDDSQDPETRGMIRTTDNMKENKNFFFTTVYDANGIYSDELTGASMGNVTVQYVQSQSSWVLGTGSGDTFGENLYHWPSDGSDIIFCSQYGNGTSNVNWHNGASLSFSYAAPVTTDMSDAAAQKDLLFAINKQNMNSRNKSGKRYADIHFDHALTAVRFVRGNLENGTVQTVSMKGFYSAGNATASYTQGESVHKDKLTFTWTPTGDPVTLTQQYNRVLTDADKKQTVGKHEVDGALLDPTTNQEYTFFMIPQRLPDGASIEIYLKERIHPITIDLTAATDGSGNAMATELRDWSTYAGKIITISVNTVMSGGLVDIDLADVLEAHVKKNVVITNNEYDHSKDSYIRVAVIANWVNKQGTIIYPYPIDNIFNDSRFDFTGVTTSDWVFNGGFYYYTKQLRTGQSVKLINTFTSPVLGDPDFPNDNTAVDHLQMTILVQGVECDRKNDLLNVYNWPNVFVE